MASKKEILDEIKRTTRENNGNPLGAKAFNGETGISWYEWGKYWAKWGDALYEAVGRRNKPWTRTPDKELVKHMINKIRKNKKYPTLAEIRIDEDIKNFYHVIKKRKQEYIVNKILDFCKRNQGYKDITEVCRPIAEKYRNKVGNNLKDKVETGEVYLYKSGRYYKIGKTCDSVRRGKEIRIQLPEETELIHVIKTDDPSGIEAYWHKRFKDKRGRGEWFLLNSQDIRAFKRWKRIY